MAKQEQPPMSELPKGVSIETKKVSELLPDDGNVRLRTKRNQEAINRSLKRFGAARSLVMDKKGVIRAGNGTLEQLGELEQGDVEAIIVKTDGKTPVIVQRDDWSDAEATAYAIADNRSSELAEWSYEDMAAQMRELNAEGIELEDTGFVEYEYAPLLKAEWTPPATTENTKEEQSNEKVGAHPVQVSMDQRERFMVAVHVLRIENAELTEGQALRLLSEAYLETRTPEEIAAAEAGDAE